jgi:hypothetical protein
MTAKRQSELEKIPGVGKTIAQYFVDVGIESIQDLQGQKPEDLYDKLCAHQGKQVDRCMLYVFRCAVYYQQFSVWKFNWCWVEFLALTPQA